MQTPDKSLRRCRWLSMAQTRQEQGAAIPSSAEPNPDAGVCLQPDEGTVIAAMNAGHTAPPPHPIRRRKPLLRIPGIVAGCCRVGDN